jgi:hypothetical protein
MSELVTRWRYFLAHQDPSLERWLDDEARHGLHLVEPGLFRFTFRAGEPREERYRLDFQMLRGAAREEYLGLFRDAGWDFLGQVANRYFFRARPDAASPEIFTDAASRGERIVRQMRVMGLITALLAFETSIGVTQLLRISAGEPASLSAGGAALTASLAGVFALLGVYILWRMEQAMKREH